MEMTLGPFLFGRGKTDYRRLLLTANHDMN